MSRHHAHAGDRVVIAWGVVVIVACAAGITAVMARILGGAS